LNAQCRPGAPLGAKALVLAVAAALFSLASPGVAAAATTPAGNLQLSVTPKVSAADTPLTISVSGLRPGAQVALTVTSVDAAGVKWRSTSTYAASSAGTVDPATSKGLDSYTGIDPMGPVDFMSPGAPGTPGPTSGLYPTWPFGLSSAWGPLYSWAKCSLSLQGQSGCSWSKPLSFRFTATSGQAHASVTVQRSPAVPVSATVETVAATGFDGVFWQPPADQDNHVGILEFYDSPGVNTPLGAFLAARGYPTLDLDYFDQPGLSNPPQGLTLEYFAKALSWLGAQPGVNSKDLWVMGLGVGSEAALLLGADYPDLVHGVAALSPHDVADCSLSYEFGWPRVTSFIWTLGGQPVPCTTQGGPQPTDNPAAVIPVAKVQGPLFADCGGADNSSSWNSCPNGEQIMTELASANDRYPHELLQYPHAGYLLGALLPYYPGFDDCGCFAGTTDVSNSRARAAQWPKLLAFLRN
jgi:dienelactone hydrolase